ncbi:MAG: hypothetical protein ACRDD2_02075 [Sarcina sp.]
MGAVFDSILYTLTPTTTSTLNFDDPILFNYDYVSDNSGIISKDITTGTFTINKAGNYLINWWVVTQTGSNSSAIGFGIKGIATNSESYDSYQAAVNPLKTGEINGNSILSLNNEQVPYKFQLVNITGYSESTQNAAVVILAQYTTAQAGITISELSSGEIGPFGPTGPQGPAGNDGPVGPTGSQGIQGPKGERGSAGPRGVAGPQGPRGPQGVKGDQGVQGPPGSSGAISKISAINATINIVGSSTINYNAPFIFNDIQSNITIDSNSLSSQSAIIINSDGSINLLEAGIYDFEWYVCIEGIDQVQQISFNIIPIINEKPNYSNILCSCNFPVIISTQFNAQGTFSITTPTTVQIINASTPLSNSNGNINLTSTLESKGNLKIIAYTTEC